MENCSEQLFDLPNEIFMYIFTYLQVNKLIQCRLVCRHWKEVIDKLFQSEKLWKLYCKNDFGDCYLDAREKASIDTNWFDIYKSLSLWPQMKFAKEVYEEFAIATHPVQEILDISIHTNGIIDVHRRNGLEYYNANTLVSLTFKHNLPSNIVRYDHNRHAIVILDLEYCLQIRRESKKDKITFDDVTGFILVDKKVYFHVQHGILYVCDLENEILSSRLLHRWQLQYILFLGYTNKLHILMTDANIFSFDNNLQFVCTLQNKPLHTLVRYNLLKSQNVEELLLWLPLISEPMPIPHAYQITCTYLYRNLLFIGTSNGFLCMYNINTFESINTSSPIKAWNFAKPDYFPVTIPTIINIDIVEAKNGHSIFVVMRKKIVVIKLYYDFRQEKDYAIVPYEEQKYSFLFNVYKKILQSN